MRKGVIAVTMLVVVGGLSAVLYSRSNSKNDKGYKLVEVTRGPVVEKALAVGAIRPKREIAVKSKISGIVKHSFHEVGDKVASGEPLFEILPDPTPLELTEAKRELDMSKNAYDQAKKRHERSETLSKQGILSNQDSEQADKDVEEARIKVGAIPDSAVEGRVYKIAPKSKTAEGATLFDVEIELLPTNGVTLRAGYSANADIVVREKKDVLLLPERLVTFTDGKASVEVPGAGETEPVKKEIKVGLSDGINVEVLEGLKQKDSVVERPPKKIE